MLLQIKTQVTYKISHGETIDGEIGLDIEAEFPVSIESVAYKLHQPGRIIHAT